MHLTVPCTPLAAALALFAASAAALAQPDTPAVTREFTVFFGENRAEVFTQPFTYADIPLPSASGSRHFTFYAGELHSDAWSREVSLEVLACNEPQEPPTIAQQPASIVLCPLPAFPVTVSIDAQDPEPIRYLWQRFDPDYADGWLPLADGFLPGIGLISGAQSATLSVTGPVLPSMTVRVVVSNSCASVLSTEATITLCAAEYNCDGAVNSGDISAYLSAWLGSIQQGDLIADFNGDLAVNSGDISAFLTAWLGAVQNGC